VTCHNEREKTAGLMLDHVDLTNIGGEAPIWEKVHRKLRDGSMPPVGRPRPPEQSSEQFAAWLIEELDAAARQNPRPGRPTMHRLNRAEYVNVIRDVFALNLDGASLLPPDDAAYGFDNIADVLSVSPSLMQRYLAIAQHVSQWATGDLSLPDESALYPVSTFLLQDERMNEDMPFGSRGGIAVRHRFVADGEYVFRIRLQQLFDNRIRGLREPSILDVFVDGELVQRFSIGGQSPRATPVPPAAQAADSQNKSGRPQKLLFTPLQDGALFNADAGLNFRAPVKAGERTVAVTFPKRRSYPEAGVERMPAMTSFAWNVVNIEPAIDRLSIDGPFNATSSGDTPSRRAIFTCRPTADQSDHLCADQILRRLATRLYRQPVGAQDMQVLRERYRASYANSGFEEGIRSAIERMLVDAQFLFRFEWEPANAVEGHAYRLSDIDLASRLSFFLWSSVPDEQLLSEATRGALHDPSVLEREVHRMLADDRSRALVTNFAGQWLWLRNLNQIQPNATLFPEWEDTLRRSLQSETELFLESMIKEDRPIPELLTANYTFVNDRLAAYYGIDNVYDSRFRRVTVTDPRRQGLLGHGSILAVTSYDDRTSPVKRGNWLLENILGAPSPPPPPNVPSLPEGGPKDRPRTMRERMAEHRKNPVCASCHSRIDPLGFALEVFDGIGQSRTTDAGKVIETAGLLPNGSRFADIVQLRALLLSPPDRFVDTVASKLLTYALGRGLEYYDLPAIRQITREGVWNEYRWSSIILAITKSVPFQMRESPAPPAPSVSAARAQVTR
jgi:hypothetical protein